MVRLTSFAAALVATATVSQASTPPGFVPASQTDLIVEYNGFIAMSGSVVPRNTTITQPRIGTLTRLAGRSYAVLMIDLDIPTDSPPATNTLLHWAQTGLTPATTPTRLNTTTGQISVFLLENSTNTAPLSGYFGPNPPARIPLSHRYTQILIDTSDAGTDSIGAIRSAAATIRGFNALTVLTAADLEDKVVAGNFYNVTNPGPVNGTAAPSGTGTGAGGAATGTPGAAGRVVVPVSLMAVVAGAVFLGL